MNSIHTSMLLAGLLATSCSNSPQPEATTPDVPGAGEDQAPAKVESVSRPAADSGLAGTVLETMDSGGYTYVLIDKGDAQVWAAGPQTSVAVGDSVSIVDPMPMPGFHSSTLGRDFELIYFSSAISGADASAAAISATSETPTSADEVEVADIEKIAKAENGQTVEELFLRKSELAGTEVVVRGKVVKFSAQIMGTNWLHLQDGTGSAETDDLTVTTSGTFAVGAVVVIRGVLVTDKDFGYGYKYDLIVEDAQITAE